MEQLERPSFRAALRAAFPVTIPVLTGYLCLGMAYGLLMQAKGYGPLWSVPISAMVYGGSIQYLAITLLTTAFDPIAAFFLALVVNARHMFYGLSMLEKYRTAGRARPFLICTLTDETYSLLSTLEPPDGISPRQFYIGVSLLDYLYWLIGTGLGGILGSVITINTTGTDFVLTALFVVLFLEQWKEPENRPAAITGLVCTAASRQLFGTNQLVLPAMALILVVLLGKRRRAVCA